MFYQTTFYEKLSNTDILYIVKLVGAIICIFVEQLLI